MNKDEWIKGWFNEVWGKGNAQLLAECATNPFNFHTSGGRSFSLTHEDYLSFVNIWQQRFNNVRFTISQVITEEHKTVALYQCEATYHGGWIKIPGKNQSVKMTGMVLFQMKDGLMTDCWLEDSSFDLYQQLTRYLE
ncbi:ester cyclase [Photobacterium indicum]|uniref:ester cyclase n=1 Tax=Photobacterium indicum TaxID=81447 RepID=UPI003D0CD086